ncbi:unnamed protein product [Paramecium pentaurelia]|uniref:Uncharacterized protein n=1 Tax=Paramecium pentaurelia TaxID=43138 RepID=A0A8S1U5V3_9CILI|nr:unnamed protein product [Paramecium pentaurelia]
MNIIKYYRKAILRPTYNFFWSKKEQNQQKTGKNDEKNQNQTGEWKGKEEYLADLRKKRDEYEKMKIKNEKEVHTQTIRQAREHEVNYGKVDFAKVFIDNINIQYSNEFKHPEEMFNFLGTLKVQLTEQNLMSCVNAFIQFADKITEDDLIRYEFQEFQAILTKQIRIISNVENLIKITKLLDILCLPSEHEIWGQLEISILNRMSKLTLKQLLEILSHLSNQKEGSDQFWDQCENQIYGEINKLSDLNLQYQSVISTMMCYWRVQRGTKQFIRNLVGIMLQNSQDQQIYQQLPINTIIQGILVMGQLCEKQDIADIVKSQQFKNYFDGVEQYLLKQFDSLNFEQICLISQGFGFEFGSDLLIQKLEGKILENFDKYELQELKFIIKSFLLSYRGSKKLFKMMMNKISSLKHEFTSIELAEIVKSYYITENDNQEFYADIERKILQRLKEVREISPQEIYEIAYSYLITRIGSREFYKLLEIVITFRFDDLRQNAILMSKLHDLYLKSALCDTKLIERMASVL